MLSDTERSLSVRHRILEQMRNGDELVVLEASLGRLDGKMTGVSDDVARLHRELTLLCEAVHDFATNLPRIVRNAARETLREWNSDL